MENLKEKECIMNLVEINKKVITKMANLLPKSPIKEHLSINILKDSLVNN